MPEIKRAIALGFFDGVHLGHAALLKKTKQRAEEIDAVPSVLSFDVHPDMLVFGKDVPILFRRRYSASSAAACSPVMPLSDSSVSFGL